jgi:hypothetical protein
MTSLSCWATATALSPKRSSIGGGLKGDGTLDLAIGNNASNTVSILMGNGDGTFAAAPWQFAVAAPQAMTLADFNGDGKPDLAIAASPGIGLANSAGQVYILLNRTR